MDKSKTELGKNETDFVGPWSEGLGEIMDGVSVEALLRTLLCCLSDLFPYIVNRPSKLTSPQFTPHPKPQERR